MNLSIADLRQNYTLAGLQETEAEANPIKQFQIWFEQAVSAGLLEPNAMTLATSSLEGKPTARLVLLKEVDEGGFTFFTNQESKKGQQLQANPQAALVFWWAELERQVRIEGRVEKVSRQTSEAYFQKRPRDSQLGAWASNQSQVIESREILEEKIKTLQKEYVNQEIIHCPPYWGGFRVIPEVIEFWQGRPSRLHDRLCYYVDTNGNWIRERLSP